MTHGWKWSAVQFHPPASPGQEPRSQLQGLHRLDVCQAGHQQWSVSGPVRADGHQPGQVRGLHQTLLQLLRHLQGRGDLHGRVVPVFLERKWVCGDPSYKWAWRHNERDRRVKIDMLPECIETSVKNQCFFYYRDHSLYITRMGWPSIVTLHLCLCGQKWQWHQSLLPFSCQFDAGP